MASRDSCALAHLACARRHGLRPLVDRSGAQLPARYRAPRHHHGGRLSRRALRLAYGAAPSRRRLVLPDGGELHRRSRRSRLRPDERSPCRCMDGRMEREECARRPRCPRILPAGLPRLARSCPPSLVDWRRATGASPGYLLPLRHRAARRRPRPRHTLRCVVDAEGQALVVGARLVRPQHRRSRSARLHHHA